MERKTTAFLSVEYDENIVKILPYYKDFIQQTIEVVKATLKKDKISWLDVGCGTGVLAEQVVQQMDIERFVLCDINDNMLDLSKQRLASYNNFTYQNVSSQLLDYQEEFDVVTSIQVNHYLSKEERKAAVTKSYRALKEGGIYITFENFRPFSKVGVENALERWKGYQLKQGRTVEDVENHLDRFDKEYYPITVQEHLELFRETGFHTSEIFWLTYLQAGFWAKK